MAAEGPSRTVRCVGPTHSCCAHGAPMRLRTPCDLGQLSRFPRLHRARSRRIHSAAACTLDALALLCAPDAAHAWHFRACPCDCGSFARLSAPVLVSLARAEAVSCVRAGDRRAPGTLSAQMPHSPPLCRGLQLVTSRPTHVPDRLVVGRAEGSVGQVAVKTHRAGRSRRACRQSSEMHSSHSICRR